MWSTLRKFDTSFKDSQLTTNSGCGLPSLSNATIRPLRNLVRRPKNNYAHHNEIYETLAPELKIFLASNLLESLPAEIVNLEHLKVLSVRNNKLTSLPQSMSRLRNIVELNVATNKLRYLPWEIVRLVQQTHHPINLHLHPNPFLQAMRPGTGLWDFSTTYSATCWEDVVVTIHKCIKAMLDEEDPDSPLLSRWVETIAKARFDRCQAFREKVPFLPINSRPRIAHAPVYLASSLVTFFGLDGSPLRSPQLAPSLLPADHKVLPIAEQPIRSRERFGQASTMSAAPSLFELCLRKATEFPIFSSLENYLPMDVPDAVERGLQTAQGVLEGGGIHCSVCEKSYIITRAEWIEYWHLPQDSDRFSTDELALPFLRRACSTACAHCVFTERDAPVNNDSTVDA